MGYYWSFDEVASKMETNIVKGLKDMFELSKKYSIDNRKAAMVLAVSRVLEAFNHKGIWP
jgi:glutamate dehydrogenase/leucine dehydrogenase